MLFRIIMRLMVFMAMVFIWLPPVLCQLENDSNLRSSYESMFEKCMEKFESKAKLSNSKSKNIRQDAYISSMKCKYLRNRKDFLIDEMIRLKLPQKEYRIHYFLNNSFYMYYESQQ